MSLLDTGTDDLIQAAEQAPPPMQRKEPAKRFSTWGMLSAAPKGVAAGAAEATGSTADILGAFGQVDATIPVWQDVFNNSQAAEKRRKEQVEASDKLRKGGIDFNSEAGRLFRDVSKDYTPDAQTAHTAENVVFNLFRVGSKALTAAAIGGNIPGAVVAGAEEGFTQSDQLGQQGVDLATRTKVGAVTAVTNAAGFALPAAGKTWMQTGALALAGGPASFVAQNAATQAILQNADYSKLAEQFDPLDPVGLALSTVLPLGFGALAMRGAKVKAKGPIPDGVVPTDVPPVHPPAEVVDAARVNLIRQHMDGSNPVPGDLVAADAHGKAYTQAMEQQAAGERVNVVDIAPKVDLIAGKATDTPNFKAWFGDSKALDDAELQASLEREAGFVQAAKPVDSAPDMATFVAAKGLDAPAAPVEPKAVKGNAFIAWLKDAGGVAWSQKTDIVGERGVRGNYAGIFTKKGQNLDTLVESAVQAGYLTRADLEASGDVGGTRALSELIRRATTGEKIATVENADAARIAQGQARAAMDAVDAMERELLALGVDPSAARGNADALGAYLAEHRAALVNKKLAEIDAETKAERIATGEAYNLSPKQIDAQARIALAGELDENAMHQAAMVARDEVDFLNRVEEIINNAPGSRKTIEGGPGSAADASISARDGQAAADATAGASASGSGPADAARSNASAVDSGAAKSVSPLAARLEDISFRNPTALDTPIRLEADAEGGQAQTMTARDFLEKIRKEAEQEAADADLLEVAANCFLSGGL